MTYRAMNDFFKERIKSKFATGYYNQILDKDNFSTNQMSIRNSSIFFRSASNASQMEGVPADAWFGDE